MKIENLITGALQRLFPSALRSQGTPTMNKFIRQNFACPSPFETLISRLICLIELKFSRDTKDGKRRMEVYECRL